MGNYDFEKDLEESKDSVEKVANAIVQLGFTDISLNHDKRYDIKCKWRSIWVTIEVKQDLMFWRTGNIAVEIQSRGKPSGPETTIATAWAYVLGNEVWVTTTNNLKALIAERQFRQTRGGDKQTSVLLLIPVEDFKSISRQIKH